MWNSLFGPSTPDIWRRDFDRVSRSIAQLKVKVTMRSDPGAKGANYREMRIILKDVALLDKALQDDIIKGTHSRGELWTRTEDLKKLNKDVKDLDAMIDPLNDHPSSSSTGSSFAAGGSQTGYHTEQNSSATWDAERGGWDMQTELQRQDQLVEHQDRELDQLSHHLTSLKQIGQDINIEVTYQNELLDELGGQIEETQDRMGRLNRKLKELMRSQSSKCLLCYIALLAVCIVVMLFSM